MPLSLSERTLAISPSVTLAIDAQAKKLRAEGMDVIPFGAGEPDFCTPEYINDAGKFAIDAGITRYTAVAGTMDLRAKICDKFSATTASPTIPPRSSSPTAPSR